MTHKHNVEQRIIFTTLFRCDLSEALGFRPDESKLEKLPDVSPNYMKQRLAFLKTVDWEDPHVMDTVMRTYISHTVSMLNDRLEGSILERPVAVSWGSPMTDEHNKLVRPALRVMVKDEETPKESYVLTFTPSKKEDGMGTYTKEFLRVLRMTLQQDLELNRKDIQRRTGIDTSKVAVHPVAPKGEAAGYIKLGEGAENIQLVARNLYEGEGKTWDITLPTREVCAKLKELATGQREVGALHMPPWFTKP